MRIFPAMRHLLTALAALLLVASAASAETMAFFMKNRVGQAVVVELNGENGKVWPGDDQVYLLEKGEQKSVPVECTGGERICYGAWLNGNDQVWWGVGADRTKSCIDCCTTCAKGTHTILLER